MSIICGDCLQVMKGFPDNHFSGIVTDPPYGLKFMGKEWDHGIPGTEFWKESLRISIPGSYLLAFGGARTYHRLACSIEDAGWEIRDCLFWCFGSGFPKSHNHFGIEGYGTALKPAYEPIIMAMKPCDGTFKQNAEKWGQAGINIDGCRIHSGGEHYRGEVKGRGESFLNERQGMYTQGRAFVPTNSPKGRWPANVIFDEEAGKMLDEMSGVSKSTGGRSGHTKAYGGGYNREYYGETKPGLGDSSGASRFFYCAKASISERSEGLKVKNFHPTVKPLKLMEYLIKLIMPPSGILLDPFAGSGSTIVAAKQLDIDAIGIEKTAEYAEIATARVNAVEANIELDLFN